MTEDPRLAELKRLLPQCLLEDQLRIGWRLSAWLKSHRQDAEAPPEMERWLLNARESVALRQRRLARLPKVDYPPDLPISAKRQEIIEAIRANQVLVIAGETGSGKTTQIPKMCLEAGYGIRAKIGCTQPRRVAALSLSRRVAEELNMEWGHEVGCKIRFSDQTSSDTYIKFMTDGMLLAEAQGDPVLSEYEAIILDEAHERSLNIDFLLGHIKQLIAKRDDLRVIITSATIDTQAFSAAFNNAPIIEVSGRMYPVDVLYAPFDEDGEDQGDYTYIDAAVNAVENLCADPTPGDVLVFMPSERDILETRDALQKQGLGIEVVPLFGRLSAQEQQRVFSPSDRRKIVIATNIAETSLTVPGIRYVVDTGLARVGRYNPRTRAKRLPIEPISQSSANQRKGRCGRVAEGICIRLYSEADFLERPLYTQPEIQRANLAEVILRLKAFHMGDIEVFPFINPPTPQSIQGGYQLLQELGALDEQRELTEIGNRLARLPVDPTIGRMIIQAERENAVKEVLIIAAGLSIQDPRERPLERQDLADAAHQKFRHPQSDFLSLLNIWTTYHGTMESMKTQGQIRRFCKTHFLSYSRMREWRDLHSQLRQSFKDLATIEPEDEFPDNDDDPQTPAEAAKDRYAAIHRSILTGLWSHVSMRKERNLYEMGGQRQAMIFPGSGIFERAQENKSSSKNRPAQQAVAKAAQPKWTVAGELVETSRQFLRTVAEIDPLWIIELAPHLIRRSYLDPRWDVPSGRVLVREKITLNGLVVSEQMISYGKVNPAEATDIFIHAGIMEHGILAHFRRRVAQPDEDASMDDAPDFSHLPALYQFLANNYQLQQKIEIWQTRLSQRVIGDLEGSILQFYQKRIEGVSSIPELNRLLKEKHTVKPPYLDLSETELLGEYAENFNCQTFPDRVAIGQGHAPLAYSYAPGAEHDGVTVQLPFTLAQLIDPGLLDWVVPGLREPQILHLLQALPKALRRPLMPLPPKAQEMARAVEPTGDYLGALIQFIREHYAVEIPANAWTVEMLPAHLRPRFVVTGLKNETVAQGRDLKVIREQLKQADATVQMDAWQKAAQAWERYDITEWNFGDLPEQIVVDNVSGYPLVAFPGLKYEEGEVSLRLFRHKHEADYAQPVGVAGLLERSLTRELAWLEKDLRALEKVRDLYITLGSGQELEVTALDNIRRHLLVVRPPVPRTVAAFNELVAQTKPLIPGLAQNLCNWTREILQLRHTALMCRKPYPKMRHDLDQLLPPLFLRQIPYSRLQHVPRYLKALLVRAERATNNPAKDLEKYQRVQPYIEALAKLNGAKITGEKVQAARWLIEEYKVSLFAQELGTAEPASPKRIEQLLAETK